LIKYIKSVLWRVAKRLSYTEDARCLKVNVQGRPGRPVGTLPLICHCCSKISNHMQFDLPHYFSFGAEAPRGPWPIHSRGF